MNQIVGLQQAFSLKNAILRYKKTFVLVALVSAMVNILLLVSPVYMLQLYDRVLTSRSEDTLIAISVMAVFLLSFVAIGEIVRHRMMSRTSLLLDIDLSPRVFKGICGNIAQRLGIPFSQPARDMEAVRRFISEPAMLVFFDVPWVPLYIFIVFQIHTTLGALSLAGGVLIFILAIANDRLSRSPEKETSQHTMRGHSFLETMDRNTHIVTSMGMGPALEKQWNKLRAPSLDSTLITNDRSGTIGAITKSFRIMLQVGVLGLGGWLVLQNEMSPGGIIAASIIAGRALAPIDQSIGAWRRFTSAKESYGRLNQVMSMMPNTPDATTPLPRPEPEIKCVNVFASLPGTTRPFLHNINLSVSQGRILGVLGPSGAGKTALASILTGVWTPAGGTISLGGINMSGWNPTDRGPYVGYLSQDVELFTGSIAQNISRFNDEVDPEDVIKATRRAHCEQLVRSLPRHYDTPIGAGGAKLSGGQKQRIGLARAMFGDPALLVLDEPDSNLDTEGSIALANTLKELQSEPCSVILITHNSRLLQFTSDILVIDNGRIVKYGARDEVLAQLAGK